MVHFELLWGPESGPVDIWPHSRTKCTCHSPLSTLLGPFYSSLASIDADAAWPEGVRSRVCAHVTLAAVAGAQVDRKEHRQADMQQISQSIPPQVVGCTSLAVKWDLHDVGASGSDQR
jgi:hypothetical protein